MCQRAVRRLCNPCERCLVRKVARLLAQPLSSNVHSLLQEITPIGDPKEAATDHSLTLRIEGGEVNDYDSAVDLLTRVADSVLFAIDQSLELPLALEKVFDPRGSGYLKEEEFPLP